MANDVIRREAATRRVAHWRIADYLGVSEGKFCRMLRHELPDGEREKVLDAIRKIEKESDSNE